ncbi:hypothetical protein Tco_0970391 [Tanacetum coccineum]
MRLASRNQFSESNAQQVARFKNGLRDNIQAIISFHIAWTMDEVVRIALKAKQTINKCRNQITHMLVVGKSVISAKKLVMPQINNPGNEEGSELFKEFELADADGLVGFSILEAGAFGVSQSCNQVIFLLWLACMLTLGNGYSLKDKNQAKTDKTERENEKSVKSQSQKVKVKDEAESEEILNGPTRTHLMGRVSPLSLDL